MLNICIQEEQVFNIFDLKSEMILKWLNCTKKVNQLKIRVFIYSEMVHTFVTSQRPTVTFGKL